MDSLVYLPYVHALLKNYCETDHDIQSNYNWLEPIFINDTAERLLAGRETEIDVLGLSCYLWNWSLQLEIANRVRKANPNCLIIMGGPHPDWKDEEFFLKYKDIDIVVKHEGEQPFLQILLENLKDKKNFSVISSLMVPSDAKKAIHTGPPLRLDKWSEKSVWQTEEMKQLALKYSQHVKIAAVWETNRGCPFQCSFCDWGSATYSKMRMLPEARLEGDLQFFAENKVIKIFIADSNFGMFPRDIDLANRVVHYKKNFGYPTLVYWATAKNKAEPVLEIAKAFLDNDLDDSVVIAIQSANQNTILEMGRGSQSLKTYKRLSHLVDQIGAPKIAQIILGSPGESVGEFKNSLNEMLELNFHRSFFVINYAVLPNAPIAAASEMQRHEIKTVTRPANRIWGYKKNLWKWKSGFETTIVGHSKMTTDDWVEMNVYKTHLMCMHHLGLTRFISRGLRNLFNISYDDFYSYLFAKALSDTGVVGQSYLKIRRHFEDFLMDENAVYALPGIDEDWYIDQESALFCWLIQDHAELKKWIESVFQEFLKLKNITSPLADNLITYQLNTIISPDYNYQTGKRFESDYDFFTYFQKLQDWDRPEIQIVKKKTYYSVKENSRFLKDQTVHFNWLENDQINMKAFQHSVIVGPYRRYMSSPVFEKLEIID